MHITKMGAAALLALAMLSQGSGIISGMKDAEDTARHAPAADPREQRFELHSSIGNVACTVAAAKLPETGQRRALTLGPACFDIAAGMETARWWTDREDGSVAFIGDDGRIVAEFAVADGAAFVSYAPRRPILTLLAAD